VTVSVVTAAGVEVNFVELVRYDGQCGGDCCRCRGELCGVGQCAHSSSNVEELPTTAARATVDLRAP